MEDNLIIVECDYCMQDLHLLDARMHETKTNGLVLLALRHDEGVGETE